MTSSAGLRLTLAFAGLLIAPAIAHAQTSGWTASVGHDTFSFRDVSRGTRPVDASPIKWRGTGPFVFARYDRATPTRTHRAEVLGRRCTRGWTSEWIASGRIRLSPALALVLDSRFAKEIFYSHSAANATERRAFIAGVTYGR